MTQEYDNTNSGALFANDKRTNDRQPTSTGSINVEGKEYWISGWTKTSKAGKKFISLAVTPKDAPAQTNDGEFEDDIPF